MYKIYVNSNCDSHLVFSSVVLVYSMKEIAMFLIMGNINLPFSDGEYCFEILMTDRSSRNLLIPAVRPSSGFSARELKNVCGQGALYLRLVESSPSDHEVLFPIHIYIYLFLTSLPNRLTGEKWVQYRPRAFC